MRQTLNKTKVKLFYLNWQAAFGQKKFSMGVMSIIVLDLIGINIHAKKTKFCRCDDSADGIKRRGVNYCLSDALYRQTGFVFFAQDIISDFAYLLFAFSTLTSAAKLVTKSTNRTGAISDSAANIVIRYGFTNTDVH